MVHSLVLDKPHKIGITADKFMLNGEKTSIKETVFVRYRFGEYNIEAIDYINEMQNKFNCSVHLAEIELSEYTCDEIALISNNTTNVPIYLYVPLTDSEIEADMLEEKRDLLNELAENGFMDKVERLMIRDRSTSLYLVSANRFKEILSKITGLPASTIGICGSPLSFGEDACISALRARDIIAYYGDPEKCKIPSANHQCMKNCGCVYYVPIETDLIAPEPTKGKASTGTKEKKEKKDRKVGQPKAPKQKVSNAPVEWW